MKRTDEVVMTLEGFADLLDTRAQFQSELSTLRGEAEEMYSILRGIRLLAELNDWPFAKAAVESALARYQATKKG